MKVIRFITLAAVAVFMASCFGSKEHAMEVEAAPVPAKPAVQAKPKPKPKTTSRPNRPPPPPQPQDGSMIVKPGGTSTASIPKVSKKDQDSAIASAQREIAKRKAGAGDADDPISKALKDVDQKDIDKAFGQLKKAASEYSGGE